MYKVVFKSGHAPEQYPKIKVRVRQSARWLQDIPTYRYCGIRDMFSFLSRDLAGPLAFIDWSHQQVTKSPNCQDWWLLEPC